MAREFNLTISLGNESMRTPADIAGAITWVAQQVVGGRHAGVVKDLNGNTVGSFELDRAEADDELILTVLRERHASWIHDSIGSIQAQTARDLNVDRARVDRLWEEL